jgi:hypothetical protein
VVAPPRFEVGKAGVDERAFSRCRRPTDPCAPRLPDVELAVESRLVDFLSSGAQAEQGRQVEPSGGPKGCDGARSIVAYSLR